MRERQINDIPSSNDLICIQEKEEETIYSRDRAMAIALDGLQCPRGRHFFTQVVIGICNQPVVAIYEGHKRQGLFERVKLQLLRLKDKTPYKRLETYISYLANTIILRTL